MNSFRLLRYPMTRSIEVNDLKIEAVRPSDVFGLVFGSFIVSKDEVPVGMDEQNKNVTGTTN